MAQCPQCYTEIEVGFGITQCPQCQFLFVDDLNAVDELEAAPELSPPPSDDFAPIDFSANPPATPFPDERHESNTGLSEESPIDDHWLFSASPSASELPPNQTEELVGTTSPGDLSEIAQYGNSEISTGREGFLLFDLIIDGIDSGQTLTDLREVLSDSRFLLNVDRLISSIKMGTLRIPALSPVKASLLVNRLKEYPLEIKWEQYAITRPKN